MTKISSYENSLECAKNALEENQNEISFLLLQQERGFKNLEKAIRALSNEIEVRSEFIGHLISHRRWYDDDFRASVIAAQKS